MPERFAPARAVACAAVLSGADEPARFAARPVFSPAAVAVEQEVGLLTASPHTLRAGARAVRLDPARMEFDAHASDAALLVINAAAYDPGWQATLDGQRVPVHPAGRHRIVMRYDPCSYALVRRVARAAVGLVIAAVVRRRVRTPTGSRLSP